MTDEPTNQPVEAAGSPTAVPTTPLTRDDARNKIFNHQQEQEEDVFCGVPILLRAPSIETVLTAQNMPDRASAMALMFVQFIHMKDGTPLFDEADTDSIKAMPFSGDVQRVQAKINKLLGALPSAEDKSPAKE